MGRNYSGVLGVKNKTIDLAIVNKSVYFKRIILIKCRESKNNIELNSRYQSVFNMPR